MKRAFLTAIDDSQSRPYEDFICNPRYWPLSPLALHGERPGSRLLRIRAKDARIVAGQQRRTIRRTNAGIREQKIWMQGFITEMDLRDA